MGPESTVRSGQWRAVTLPDRWETNAMLFDAQHTANTPSCLPRARHCAHLTAKPSSAVSLPLDPLPDSACPDDTWEEGLLLAPPPCAMSLPVLPVLSCCCCCCSTHWCSSLLLRVNPAVRPTARGTSMSCESRQESRRKVRMPWWCTTARQEPSGEKVAEEAAEKARDRTATASVYLPSPCPLDTSSASLASERCLFLLSLSGATL